MALPEYKLRILGARGTVPSPSRDKLGYGGHTSCLAAELDGGRYLILDCGSGLRLLGNELSAKPGCQGLHFHVFFSHYHFDHVEGLPLFSPLYDQRSTFSVYGFEPEGRPVREVLESLIRPPYFPVALTRVPATIDYVPLNGQSVAIGDVTVHSLPLNHPDGCLSYRLERGDRSIVYATDHEHGDAATDKTLIDFARDANCLIYDATYMHGEYESLRRGWGHSTWYAAVRTAVAAGVESLVLFHHHPDHQDYELERILEVARMEFPATELAREGAALLL